MTAFSPVVLLSYQVNTQGQVYLYIEIEKNPNIYRKKKLQEIFSLQYGIANQTWRNVSVRTATTII